jgi:hypothetical protein
MNEPISNNPVLDLRDIHLPEPVSWWPVAPGWWILIAGIFLIVTAVFISRKIYLGKQLKRDINAELENIKQQFQKTQNRVQLAEALSILLRRACITYFPAENIAGLTGNRWLAYLDKTHINKTGRDLPDNEKFQSDIGKVLLTAPYLPDNTGLDYDAQILIRLCESWLKSPRKITRRVSPS